MGARVPTDKMIAALQACDGMVYLTAKRLKCHPTTIYDRAKKVQAVQDVIDQAGGEVLDIGETALKRAVLAGEAWAVCFLLKTKGRSRGYAQQMEHTGPNGGAIQIIAIEAGDSGDNDDEEPV